MRSIRSLGLPEARNVVNLVNTGDAIEEESVDISSPQQSNNILEKVSEHETTTYRTHSRGYG